jgi:hypothetical protein
MKVLDKIRRASFWGRYWSLLAALVLPVLVFFIWDSENTRFLAAGTSIALLGHSWAVQRRCSQGGWKLLLWTSVLLFPMLTAIWSSLNVIRVNTYDYAADYQHHLGDYRQNLYWQIVETQDWIVWAIRIDMLLCLLFAAIVLMRRKASGAQNQS